jgi:hypothetical protein
MYYEYSLGTTDLTEGSDPVYESKSDSGYINRSDVISDIVRQNYYSTGIEGVWQTLSDSSRSQADYTFTASTSRIHATMGIWSGVDASASCFGKLDARNYFVNNGSVAITVSFTYHYDCNVSGPYTDTGVGALYSLIKDESSYFFKLPEHFLGGPAVDSDGEDIYNDSQYFGSKQNVAEVLDSAYTSSLGDMSGTFLSEITLQPGQHLLLDNMLMMNSLSYVDSDTANDFTMDAWFTYIVTSGAEADFVALDIPGSGIAVPEPSETAAGAGALVLIAALIRRRRQGRVA